MPAGASGGAGRTGGNGWLRDKAPVDDHDGALPPEQRADALLQVVKGVAMLAEDDELLSRRRLRLRDGGAIRRTRFGGAIRDRGGRENHAE
jgi:hypothetical protein